MTGPRRRRAFTLVELLVVIAIIGVLVALLLPAIQAAREAARRTQCKTNFKNLALGLLNYHDTHKAFPAGVVQVYPTPPATTDVPTGNWGWGALVLPFLEEAPLYDAIRVKDSDLAKSMDVPAQLAAMQTSLSIFRCPSDQGPIINDERKITSAAGDQHALSTSNYVGVNSSNELRRDAGQPDDRAANGIFVRNVGTPLRRVTDGTSNTFLMGERAWESELADSEGIVLSRGGVVFGIRGVRDTSEIGLADSMGCGKYVLNFASAAGSGPSHNSKARRGFSSVHPGGAHFAACDGSVRFVADDIEGGFVDGVAATEVVDTPWEAMLGKDDGVTINEP